jgi:hypothetical protein
VFAFSGKYNTTLDGILRPLWGVEGKSIVFGPAGNTSGKPKESALGYLSKYDKKPNLKGITTFDAEFTVVGAITDGTF